MARLKTPGFLVKRLIIERDLRKLWASGVANFPSLCLMRGRIRFVFLADRTRTATELWSTSAFIHVNWFMDQIPPTLRDGEMATVLGSLNTANLGTRICLQQALAIPKGGVQVRKQCIAFIAKSVLAPSTYTTAEEFNAFIEKRIMKRKKPSGERV